MRTLVAAVVVVEILAGCAGRTAGRGPAPSSGSYATAPRPAGTGVSFDDENPTLERAIQGGRAARKPVVLYFLASWCGYCSKLQAGTLSKPEVGSEMSRFWNVRCDPDDPAGRTLALKYGVNGFPTLVFVDAAGNKKKELAGCAAPADFISRVRAASP